MLLPARMAHVLPPSGFMNFSRNCWTEKPVNASSHPTQYEADKVKAYTFKLRVRFELTIPVAERWKTAHVFDKAAIAIGLFMRRIRIWINVNLTRTTEDVLMVKGSSTGLFISPSGISELDCATTKTDKAERSISIGRESLQVFFVLGALAYFQVPPLGGSREEKWRSQWIRKRSVSWNLPKLRQFWLCNGGFGSCTTQNHLQTKHFVNGTYMNSSRVAACSFQIIQVWLFVGLSCYF